MPLTRDSEPLWWQTGVIYQVYPRSFQDANGDGVGDLAGVIERLDYLSEILGVDAIWLSPIFPSPMADFGYDVSDYTGIDPLFGDLATFDRLLEQVHQRRLKLLLDLVPNHTSDQHPWFRESRASRNNPRRNWYIWADPRLDGSPPNNWLSVFGGPAWEWDEATGQYYLHSFLKEQPDLNWRNPQVKEAMFEVARFWLDRGVDGFRIDVAHYILKDPLLRDNPPAGEGRLASHRPMGEYDSQLHLYDKGHSDVHSVYREFRKLLDSYSAVRPRVSIGEIHIFEWAEWASYYGAELDELHMPFNFSLLGIEWRAQAVRRAVDALEAVLAPGAWPNYVLGNHDEPRLATRLGRAAARVAAMLLLTLRGTPTLYYGDEIGMLDVEISPERRQDPLGRRTPRLGRDPARTPMQWSPGPNAGFSPPERQDLWLPLAGDYPQVNVASQLEDETSLLNLYRRLLAYRKSSPALRWGAFTPLEAASEDCFAFLRQASASPPLLVVLNFSEREVSLELGDLGKGTLCISTHLDRRERLEAGSLKLRGDEGVLIELESG